MICYFLNKFNPVTKIIHINDPTLACHQATRQTN